MKVTLKSQIKIAIAEPKSKRRGRPVQTIGCNRCHDLIPRIASQLFNDKLYCRNCYMMISGIEMKACTHCKSEKPLTTVFFYLKQRGGKFMDTCRICTANRDHRCNLRVCGTCWRRCGTSKFSIMEFLRPQFELAKCINCSKEPPIVADRGERVCPRCNTPKSLDCYHVRGTRCAPYCKDCTSQYNKERYRQGRDMGHRSQKQHRFIYALDNCFTDQQRVDAWYNGETLDVPDIDIPEGAVSKAKPHEIRKITDGLQLAMGLIPERTGRSAYANKPKTTTQRTNNTYTPITKTPSGFNIGASRKPNLRDIIKERTTNQKR